MAKTKIMVVEDEVITAEGIRNRLEGLGYAVVAMASSGEEAIRKIDEVIPDLVLMDIGLDGDMDGVDTAEKIRASFDIPVVYLTAYADDRTLQRAKITEPFGYIVKPFTTTDLQSTLEMALYRHNLDSQLKQSESRYRDIAAMLARQAKIDSALAELSSALLSSASLEDISFRVLDHVRNLTGSEFGFVGYIDPETGYLISSTLSRDVWDVCGVVDKDLVFKNFTGLWGWVLNHKQSLLCNSPAEDPRSTGIPKGHLPIERFLSAPALIGDRLVGQLALANPNSDYTGEDLTVVERLALIYALALQRQQAEIALQKAHDELERRVEERTAELKKANQQLQQEMEERKRTEQILIRTERFSAMGKLAASVAHEINNPLQAVVGYLGLAQEELVEGEDITGYLYMAHEEVRRAARTVSQMRDFGRAGTGEREPVLVNSLLEQVLSLTRKQCQMERVEVSWKPSGDLPALLLEPDQMKQVFLNMIINALEAMPDGGQLYVDTNYTDQPAGISIKFTDTGVGIPAEHLNNIFEPFYSTKPEGTGLGLAISFGIVKEHGGRIDVSSQIDQGTTFEIWLPVEMEI